MVDEFDAQTLGNEAVYEFPSLAPELLLGLEGEIIIDYKGRRHSIVESTLFSHIDEGFMVYPHRIRRMIVVKFKNRGMAAIMPFVGYNASELIARPFAPGLDVFGRRLEVFECHLRTLPDDQIAPELDSWLMKTFNRHATGIVYDLSDHLTPSMSVSEVIALTRTSYSTVERHFRTDTGLSPKQYLMRNRARHAVRDIFATAHTGRQNDWFDLVASYAYHDQSHFIKEIKRFTGFTPAQLVSLPWFSQYRPQIEP